MPDDKARVLARGTAACPDFDAMDREPAVRRTIGRKYQEITPGDFGYVPVLAIESVSRRAEVARAIADGDLWPADQATAEWAESVTRGGVKFDPTFGGNAALAACAAPPIASAKVEKESSK